MNLVLPDHRLRLIFNLRTLLAWSICNIAIVPPEFICHHLSIGWLVVFGVRSCSGASPSTVRGKSREHHEVKPVVAMAKKAAVGTGSAEQPPLLQPEHVCNGASSELHLIHVAPHSTHSIHSTRSMYAMPSIHSISTRWQHDCDGVGQARVCWLVCLLLLIVRFCCDNSLRRIVELRCWLQRSRGNVFQRAGLWKPPPSGPVQGAPGAHYSVIDCDYRTAQSPTCRGWCCDV